MKLLPAVWMVLQHDPVERFGDAPKASLFRVLINSLFRDSPVIAWICVGLAAVLAFGVPAFLAWDFAKGARRRAWVWLSFAAVGSWLVLPVMWFASSRLGGDASNPIDPGP